MLHSELGANIPGSLSTTKESVLGALRNETNGTMKGNRSEQCHIQKNIAVHRYTSYRLSRTTERGEERTNAFSYQEEGVKLYSCRNNVGNFCQSVYLKFPILGHLLARMKTDPQITIQLLKSIKSRF